MKKNLLFPILRFPLFFPSCAAACSPLRPRLPFWRQVRASGSNRRRRRQLPHRPVVRLPLPVELPELASSLATGGRQRSPTSAVLVCGDFFAESAFTANEKRFRLILKQGRQIMAMTCKSLLREITVPNKAAYLVGIRGFAAGGKAKKGSKGGASDAPKASALSKELKSTTVYGANILKDGSDPKILPEAEYPDWLLHLLDKRPPLSELRRKEAESLSFEDLKRYVKLDNRARIKENNAARAKN